MPLFGMCGRDTRGFEFAHSHPVSESTTREYRHVKGLFLRSIEILRTKERRDPVDSIGDIKKLMLFYESADVFMCSLVNEVFRMGFVEGMEGKQKIFEMLNKLLKMFFLFDIDRLRHVQVFHDYSMLAVYNCNELAPRLSVNEMLKIATFSAVSMPMARLFLTYFNTDALQMFHPIILCKRAPIYLSSSRRQTLNFVCRVMCRHGRHKYVVIFFCALYENSFDTDCFSEEIRKLTSEEQSYYRAVKNMR